MDWKGAWPRGRDVQVGAKAEVGRGLLVLQAGSLVTEWSTHVGLSFLWLSGMAQKNLELLTL